MESSVLFIPPPSPEHSSLREYSETKLRSIEEARAVDCTTRQEWRIEALFGHQIDYFVSSETIALAGTMRVILHYQCL